MKRYDPGLEGPCPELERAVMEECSSGEYVRVNDVLSVIKGCWDYGGGYHGNDEHMEVFRHGMQTVLNAMCGAMRPDGSDLQSDVLLAIGRKTIRADAALLAAAPELLEALINMRRTMYSDTSEESVKADAAIAKALGKVV